jgi:hypothetical protein|tara:strand:+ start:119 stop:289 length:171 start_codon:yes stop_codon:yes gene_type:complete
MTEVTRIRTATPREMPIKDIIETKDKKPLRLLLKYLSAIDKERNLILKFLKRLRTS